MLRSIATLLATLAVASPLRAQTDARGSLVPVGPPEYAGVHDLATGVTHPPGSGGYTGTLLGVSLYRNTCPTGAAVTASSAEVLTDTGRIPSSTSISPVGARDSYLVKSFQIGYATAEADIAQGGPGARVLVSFYQDFDPCADPASQPAPIATFDVNGLPGSSTSPAVEAKVVTVALPGNLHFCLAADATTAFDGAPDQDSFGYSLQLVDQTLPGGGILLGSDPSTCFVGFGTVWNAPTLEGTGLDNPDQIRRDPTAPHCIDFGGSPHAGLWMAVNGDINQNCTPGGRPFCSGAVDGAGCTPVVTISGIARKTLGFGPCTLSATQVHNLRAYSGFYGLGQGVQLNFGNGFRCVQAPLTRILPVAFTGGTAGPPDCSGAMSRNLNPLIANDPSVLPGDTVFVQFLYRDSVGLSAMPTHGMRAHVFP